MANRLGESLDALSRPRRTRTHCVRLLADASLLIGPAAFMSDHHA